MPSLLARYRTLITPQPLFGNFFHIIEVVNRHILFPSLRSLHLDARLLPPRFALRRLLPNSLEDFVLFVSVDIQPDDVFHTLNTTECGLRRLVIHALTPHPRYTINSWLNTTTFLRVFGARQCILPLTILRHLAHLPSLEALAFTLHPSQDLTPAIAAVDSIDHFISLTTLSISWSRKRQTPAVVQILRIPHIARQLTTVELYPPTRRKVSGQESVSINTLLAAIGNLSNLQSLSLRPSSYTQGSLSERHLFFLNPDVFHPLLRKRNLRHFVLENFVFFNSTPFWSMLRDHNSSLISLSVTIDACFHEPDLGPFNWMTHDMFLSLLSACPNLAHVQVTVLNRVPHIPSYDSLPVLPHRLTLYAPPEGFLHDHEVHAAAFLLLICPHIMVYPLSSDLSRAVCMLKDHDFLDPSLFDFDRFALAFAMSSADVTP